MLVENNAYPQDGRVRREAATLTKAGYRVAVIAPAAKGQPLRETVRGVDVYRYPAPQGGDGLLGYALEYGLSLAAMLLLSLYVFIRRGFDVIHAHNPPDLLALVAALYKPLGVRFVFDHHDLAPEMYYARFSGQGSPTVHRVLVRLEQLSCRVADLVIATNASYRAVEVARDGVPPHRVRIVRNGPELDRVLTVPPDPALRPSGRTLIGFAGDMAPHDGVDGLLRALRCLVHDLGRTDFLCFVVGRGQAWEDLRRLSSELGLDAFVRFTGWVTDEELRRVLSTVDICVDPDPPNPFTDRSTMIKMTEYMAFGKPIVAFDLTEHRVTAGDAALYAEAGDEIDFARQIARLMDDPALRRDMGRLGRHRVETTLAWPHQEPHLLSAYATLFPPLPPDPGQGSRGAEEQGRLPSAPPPLGSDPACGCATTTSSPLRRTSFGTFSPFWASRSPASPWSRKRP